MENTLGTARREAWNKGKIVSQKAPLKLKDIWALRVRLQMASRARALALFISGSTAKHRGCDLVKLKVRDCLPWRPGYDPSYRHAAEDPAVGPVRDHATHARHTPVLDQAGRAPLR